MKLADNEVSSLRPSPLVALPGFGDETSEARRIGDWEDDVATALRPNPFGEEQETVIRRMPPPGLDGKPSTGVDERPSEGPATVRLEKTTSGERAARARAQAQASPVRPKERPQSAVGWFGWLLTIFALFAGLALGAGSTVLVGAVAGVRPSVATPTEDARIRVSAPAGTAVLLDGDAIGAEAPAKHGVPHHLELRFPGHPAVHQEITLQPGEIRVIVVTPVAAPPPPPEPVEPPGLRAPKPAPRRPR